jgi:hypothetical protein
MRIRLLVVVAARTAIEEQNLLSVWSHRPFYRWGSLRSVSSRFASNCGSMLLARGPMPMWTCPEGTNAGGAPSWSAAIPTDVRYSVKASPAKQVFWSTVTYGGLPQSNGCSREILLVEMLIPVTGCKDRSIGVSPVSVGFQPNLCNFEDKLPAKERVSSSKGKFATTSADVALNVESASNAGVSKSCNSLPPAIVNNAWLWISSSNRG